MSRRRIAIILSILLAAACLIGFPATLCAQELPPQLTGPAPDSAVETELSETEEVLPKSLYDPIPELSQQAWFDPIGLRETWDISFEFGVNGNKGNSDTVNVTSGLDLEQKRDLFTNFIRFRYATGYAAGVETKNNAILKLGHERDFAETRWSWFVRSDLIHDRFKSFDLRLVANTGLGYQFFDNDVSSLQGRLGAGASREFGGPDNQLRPEAVFGMDYKRQLTKRQSLTSVIDYYPEIGDFKDYRFVADISWECLIDEEANLSLKLSIVDEYDSTPNGRRPNDLNYAFLLLWNF